jgi:hypothetical protein
MKPTLFCLLLVVAPVSLFAQAPTHQQGTIVRMRMTDCQEPQHGFMAAMSGNPKMDLDPQCPEYVLVSEDIVYVISGKTSDQLLPLAETTRFHFRKNEMLIRVDDAPKECHFHIKAMMMRPEWDRAQMLEAAAVDAMISQHSVRSGSRNQQ